MTTTKLDSPKKTYVTAADRAKAELDPDKKLSELRVRDLFAILLQLDCTIELKITAGDSTESMAAKARGEIPKRKGQ